MLPLPVLRCVLWAHNSHVGDSKGRGAKYAEIKWNIGQVNCIICLVCAFFPIM